jgi:hypothetical protein
VAFLIVAEVAVTLWLGLYLMVREPGAAVSRRAAAGLLGYSAALAAQLLADSTAETAAPLAGWLDRLLTLLVCLPALAWTGAAIRLLPAAPPALDRLWARVAVPVTLAVAVLATAFPPVYPLLAALVLAPLLGVLVLVARSARTLRPAPVGPMLAVATLFFVLGAALLLVPLDRLPRTLLLLGVDFDLLALGVAVAWCAAFDAGETLRRDMLRSLLAAFAVASLFGGQVLLVMLAGPGVTPALTALLLGTVAAAVAVQVLAGPAHGVLDRLVFAGTPRLTTERAQLREAEAALPRRDAHAAPEALDPEEFVRLTRRALSNYGDLARLTASPLVNLPVIDERLAARRAPDQPLERAAELKALLLESIQRLKPRDGDFGTTEEWRYYNALYFPYVLGLRPYRRSTDRRALDPVARQAFDWFATQVPERTLYNWQNAAARLVAEDLRGHGDRSMAQAARG